jgi:hypothetical protein
MDKEVIMSSAITVIFFALGLLFLYGFGVFAMCLHAGETMVSAAIEASGWWIAFAVSHFLSYLAVTLY